MKIFIKYLVTTSLRKSNLNKTEQTKGLDKDGRYGWFYDSKKIVSIYWLRVCISLMIYLHDLLSYLYSFHCLRVLLTR